MVKTLRVVIISFAVALVSCQHHAYHEKQSPDNLQLAQDISEKIVWADDGIFSGIEIFGPVPNGFKLIKNKSGKHLKFYSKDNYDNFSRTDVHAIDKDGKLGVVRIVLLKYFRTEYEANDFYSLILAGLSEKFKIGPAMTSEITKSISPTVDTRGLKYSTWYFKTKDQWIEGYVKEKNNKFMSGHFNPTASSRYGISNKIHSANVTAGKMGTAGEHSVLIFYETSDYLDADRKEKEIKRKELNL